MVDGFVTLIFGNVVINRNHARDAVGSIIQQGLDSQLVLLVICLLDLENKFIIVLPVEVN